MYKHDKKYCLVHSSDTHIKVQWFQELVHNCDKCTVVMCTVSEFLSITEIAIPQVYAEVVHINDSTQYWCAHKWCYTVVWYEIKSYAKQFKNNGT